MTFNPILDRQSREKHPQVAGRADCRLSLFACSTVRKFSGVMLLMLFFLTSASGCGVVSQGQNAEGVKLYQQGYYQAALRQFEVARNSDPQNANSYYNLAATYHLLGKRTGQQEMLDRAEAEYNRCLDFAPNHREGYRALAVLLVDRNRKPEAIRLLEGWASRNPGSPDPRIELARLSEEFGNREGARNYLVEALTLNPRDSRALTALGHLHEQMGNPQQALANYERSLGVNRFQPEVTARVASLRGGVDAPLNGPGDTRWARTPGGVAPR